MQQPALLDEPQQLATEPPHKQVVGNKINGRVDHDQKRSDLVERVQRHVLEDPLRFVDECPDAARNQRRSLTDEEDDDNADEHDRRIDSAAHDGVDLPRAPARSSNGLDEERVEDGQRSEGQTADEDDVEPGVVELAKELRLAEGRQVAADANGAVHRVNDTNRSVLEELGQIEDDADEVEREDDLPRSTDRTVALRLKGMTYDDVSGKITKAN